MSFTIPKLTDVERICNTSVYDAGITIRNCTDAGLLKRALKHEFEHRQRKTLIRTLGRRIKQLTNGQD